MTLASSGKAILEQWRVILENHPNRHLSIVNEERRAVIALVDTLEACIRDVDWMARRYADGSRTYATSTYNDSKRILTALGLELRLDPISGTPWARDGGGARYGNLSSEEHALGIPLRPIDLASPLSPDAQAQRERLLALEERVKLLEQVYSAADTVWYNTKNINEGYWGVDAYAMEGLKSALDAVQHAARVEGES